jgi:hypothetical protein
MAFAALVSAEQVTTSFWALEVGTDKLGYYGSVVGAEDGHLTLALEYDNGTTPLRGEQRRRKVGTWTVGPTMYEYSEQFTVEGDQTTNLYGVHVYCEKTDTAGNAPATCTQEMEPGLASAFFCDASGPRDTTVYTDTETHFYGSGIWGAPGVETLTEAYSQNERNPWCDDASANTNSFTSTWEVRSGQASAIATYQVVITAGEEKMTATAGAGAGTGTAKPTGTGAPTGASSGNAAGLAAPMKTGVPALAGVGALAAAFFL